MTETLRERFLRLASSTNGDLSPEGTIAAGIGLILKELEGTLRPSSMVSVDFLPNLAEDIQKFQEKFHQKYDGPPRFLSPQLAAIRKEFMQEELKEWWDAVQTGDLTAQYDALIDLLFFTLGTMYLQGFPVYEGWNEVLASNMSKEYVENGGKAGCGVHKGRGYYQPDLGKVLREWNRANNFPVEEQKEHKI